jgi:hypothetical protein
VPNSGLVTDAVESGVVDVAFMPLDDERVGHTKWPPERGPFNLVRDRTLQNLAALPLPLRNRHTITGLALRAGHAIATAAVRSLDHHTRTRSATLSITTPGTALFLDPYGRRADPNIDLRQLKGKRRSQPRLARAQTSARRPPSTPQTRSFSCWFLCCLCQPNWKTLQLVPSANAMACRQNRLGESAYGGAGISRMWKRFPSGGVHRAGTCRSPITSSTALSRYRMGAKDRCGLGAPDDRHSEAPRQAIHRIAETRLRACLAPIMRVDQAVAPNLPRHSAAAPRGPLTAL